jgi:hypothetical protein
MKQSLPKSTTLITSAELAETIGADLETINNWIQRGIISRVAIGGRQLRARLFSSEEVYKAALTNELVTLGIAPSPASEAAIAVWKQKQWNGKDAPEGQKVYAIVVPSKNGWTVELCSRKAAGGPLYRWGGTGRKLAEVELPTHTFAVIPISDVFERVSSKIARLLGG